MKKFEILKILKDVEHHSTCMKRKVGAILLEDGQWVASGANRVVLPTLNYVCSKCSNGDYKKEPIANCGKCHKPTCPAVHAEIQCLTNYLIQIHKYNSLVISWSPCPECCKVIKLLGIDRVYVATTRDKKVPLGDNFLYNVETYDQLAEVLLKPQVEYIRLQELEDTEEVK